MHVLLILAFVPTPLGEIVLRALVMGPLSCNGLRLWEGNFP